MSLIHDVRRIAFLACAFALVASCGDADRSAGNSGTSTDNVVTARLYSIDSIAARLERPDTGAYPLLVELDSSDIDFSKALPDGGDLLVQKDDSSALPFHFREWNQRERIASLWVRVPRADLWWHRSIRISHGGDVRWDAADSAATWKGVSAAMRSRVTSFTIADFEQDSAFALLPCQCNRWYVGWSSDATLYSPYKTHAVEPAIAYDAERKSRALHLVWSASISGWVLFGTRLGTTWHRLASLDSVVFWAKGNGAIRIAFEDRADSSGLNSSDLRKAWANVDLSPVWKRYSVRPSDFLPPDQWNVGWPAIRERSNTFTVFGVTGSEFWIDDIQFHGISRFELR